MAEDAAAAANRPASRRKRKAQSHPDGGDTAPSSARGRSVEALTSEYAAILRGAIEFRDRTGFAPTKTNMPAFYDSVKDSLSVPLSQSQIYNKLRNIRHKANRAAWDDAEDIVLELAAKLWPEAVIAGKKGGDSRKKAKKPNLNAQEEDGSAKKAKKAGKNSKSEKNHQDVSGQKEVDDGSEKENNEKSTAEQKLVALEKEEKDNKVEEDEGKKTGEERGIKAEDFPFFTASIAKYWEANGLTKASLEIGMKFIDPARAKVLEEKWSKLLEEEMKFQMGSVSTLKELWGMLVATHKDQQSDLTISKN